MEQDFTKTQTFEEATTVGQLQQGVELVMGFHLGSRGSEPTSQG